MLDQMSIFIKGVAEKNVVFSKLFKAQQLEDQIQQTALHRAVRVPNNINVVRLLLGVGVHLQKLGKEATYAKLRIRLLHDNANGKAGSLEGAAMQREKTLHMRSK